MLGIAFNAYTPNLRRIPMKKIITLTAMLFALASAFTVSAKPGDPTPPNCNPGACIVSK
jgi:hypothetical protein